MQSLELSQIQLCLPNLRYKDSFIKGYEELSTDADRVSWNYLGESAPIDIPSKNFEEYVNTLLKRATNPPPHFVCDSVYWAIYKYEMIGRIAIRHELNDFLKIAGGHIGYIVRPSYRGKGVASQMLKQILTTPKAKEISKLLVTCDENNIASEKTIRKNGGVQENIIEISPDRPRKMRFWIELL